MQELLFLIVTLQDITNFYSYLFKKFVLLKFNYALFFPKKKKKRQIFSRNSSFGSFLLNWEIT